MSAFDPDYNSRADYDMDGKVDDFEYGLFLNEMEEEDRTIEEGEAFFGSSFASCDPDEDYIGLDLESCTILDPDYIGNESLEELVERYGIDLTREDIEFYRDSQRSYTPPAAPVQPVSRTPTVIPDRPVWPVKCEKSTKELVDEYLAEGTPDYVKAFNRHEIRRRLEAGGIPLEDLRSWKRHAFREELAQFRACRRDYAGEWARVIGIVLFVMLVPIAWMLYTADDPVASGPMKVVGVILIGIIIIGAIMLFGSDLRGSADRYRREVEALIAVSNEIDRQRSKTRSGK